MEYYEIQNTVYLKKDIHLSEVHLNISKLLNFGMTKNKFLKELHSERGIKMYCFDYLFPRVEGKIYSKNGLYMFKVRTPKKEIAENFYMVLNNLENDEFKIMGSVVSKKRYMFKEELYTATPAICTLGKRYWNIEDGIELLEEKISKNLVSKYKSMFKEDPQRENDFVCYIEKKNKKPISIKYKYGSLYGNKFSIRFNTDEMSMKMSYLAYTTGLLEKGSSLGTGFCV